MKMITGNTLTASTNPTATVLTPPAGPGACTRVTLGQSPNTKRMPASANDRKSLARSLAAMNRRWPTRVRIANSAMPICSPRPHARMRPFSARRRSTDTAKAMPSSTAIPARPIMSVQHQRRAREAGPQPVDRAQHRRPADEATFESGLSRKVEQRETDQRRQQPLPRHAGQRHDDAQREEHGPGQVLEDQPSHTDRRVPVSPESGTARTTEVIDRPADDDERHQHHAAREHDHGHDQAPPPMA